MKKKIPIERISKTFLILNNLKLKICVIYGKKDLKTDKRISSTFLYEYSTSKYFGGNTNLLGVTLETSDFLILEIHENKNKEAVYLSYPHIFRFKKLIEKGIEWLTSKEYEDLYYLNFQNQLSLTMNKKKASIRNLPNGNYISILPSIIDYEQTEIKKSILFILNDNLSVNLDLRQLYTLNYTIEKFDLFLYAQSLTNYVELLRLRKKKK